MALIGGGVLVAGAAFVWHWTHRPAGDEPGARHDHAVEVQPVSHATEPSLIEMPADRWEAAGIKLQSVQRGPFQEAISLTGKVALNEDRISHVFPLVEGRVEEVKVQFGQHVKQGDVLVVIQSKEVGHAKLQLFQDRQQLELALMKDKWTQESSTNVLAMLDLIRSDASIEAIEAKLRDRPLGEYRERLMSAYLDLYRAKLHYDRLTPLAKEGAIPGKQLVEAEAARNAARAALQSLVEQLTQETRQMAAISAQTVKELKTRVAVDETTLLVMGFPPSELNEVDPVKLGERISHYTIRAPFAGTIISKDVTQLEYVRPDSQILSIADLSTVWVTADIYERHLPQLQELAGKEIQLRSSSWPDRTFTATVFYTGDIVQEASRTVALRARADNKDGLLKPGMFVNIEIEDTIPDVLQVPLTAVQEHEGESFVFVRRSDHEFERCDVQIGRRNTTAAEITAGVEAGDQIAVEGGFALKSQMLAELLAGD
jgi:cobalt-zinc-cadmium efflux system membrane fusion protein